MACSIPSQRSGDHAQLVAGHYNQIEETGLAKRTLSRIFYLRNFNNWTKSVLISDTLKKLREENHNKHLSVLDLCSGKGGDLQKWRKGRINKLVCVDIADVSVEQSEIRYKQIVQQERGRIFDAEFITADCTKERIKDKYKNKNQDFDVVSCQFSFHYCFESYPQTMMMLRNACESLRPGGYFIGTTPNSQELVRRLRQSSDSSFGNEVYRISFQDTDKTNFPLFGAFYNFHLEGVVDCPEFLVYFPVLERMAAQFGMKLVKKQTFAEFFQENVKKRENLVLLNNMQALEPYPPFEGTESMSSNPEDYKNAQALLNSISEYQDTHATETHSHKRIGTLSQAEWDAATIYLIFIFQKVADASSPVDTGGESSVTDTSGTPRTIN